jgi:hypothetical protein
MPWTPDDGPARHTKKATSSAKRRQWSDAANSARDRALAAGKSEQEADAIGVRVGNAAVKNHPPKKKR